MIDKRINYAWGGPGGKSPGSGGPGPGGQGARGQATQNPGRAPAPSRGPVTTAVSPPSILSRPAAPITTAKAPPSILSRPAAPLTRNIHVDTPEIKAEQKVADELNRQKEIRDLIAQQQEEKYGPTADPDIFGEKIDKRTQKEKDEDWERAQDWDLVKDLSKKGYDFDEIQDAVEKGLTVKAPTTSARRQNLIDTGLASIRNIVPETGLERSLLSRAKSFTPDSKTGIMSSLGNYAKRAATNFALKKMGLGFINPLMGIASLFGFKNPFANIGTKFAGVPTKKGPVVGGDGGQGQGQTPANVIQAGMKQFQPTDQQTSQMDEIRRKRMTLQGYADKGALNERGQNTLAQMNQMISQYQVDPGSIYG